MTIENVGAGQQDQYLYERKKGGKNRLWINTCLPPKCGRAKMLRILMDMATKYEQRPGNRPSHFLGRGFITSDTDNKPCNLESVQTQSRTPSPQSQGTKLPMRWPVSWPKCLGRGLPHAPTTPPPMPSSCSEPDSSCLPSFESITRPESSYEASDSFSTD